MMINEELTPQDDDINTMMHRKSEEGIVDDELDMTPMVDVTFLLLIFFMITAAFALQKSISIPPMNEEASQTQTVEDLEEDSIVIQIDEDNYFWVSGPAFDEEKAVSKQEMRELVQKASKADSKGTGPTKLLVKAHGDSRHGMVVAALDAGSGAGMEEVKLMSYEDGDL